ARWSSAPAGSPYRSANAASCAPTSPVGVKRETSPPRPGDRSALTRGRVPRETSPASADQRGDDEVAVGLLALAVRLDASAIAQVLVHELALAGRHHVEGHGTALAAGVLGCLVGQSLQRLLAARAVAL